MQIKHIIISRTDSIGDVMLTLPLCGYLKSLYPQLKITFIGRSYTKPVIELSTHVDSFINWDNKEKLSNSAQATELENIAADCIIHVFPNKTVAMAAKKAKIKWRIGTSHRTYHWVTCNKKVSFSRKKSSLHEAQLNFKLLISLGIKIVQSLTQIAKLYGYPKHKLNDNNINAFIHKNKKNIILHPKSKGSAREWGLTNFSKLIDKLPDDYNIILCGTETEGSLMQDLLNKHKNRITNSIGKLTLNEYIELISNCNTLVAASTGPLHIAAALGINAIGLYAPMRPIHPGRWSPLGENAKFLVIDKECSICRKTNDCECIRSISIDDVINAMQ